MIWSATVDHQELSRKNDKYLALQLVLQAFAVVLMFIVTGLTGWALTRIFDHEGRLIRVETNAATASDTLKEVRADVKEIKQHLLNSKP